MPEQFGMPTFGSQLLRLFTKWVDLRFVHTLRNLAHHRYFDRYYLVLENRISVQMEVLAIEPDKRT